MRQRLLLWLGWPMLVVVMTTAVVHFLRYRLGIEVYWTWDAARTLLLGGVMLIPPLSFEGWVRRNRERTSPDT